jgi:hypothetical protein
MIEENNKLIAEFVGMQHTDVGWYDNDGSLSQFIYDTTSGNCHDKPHFHDSWDWLMPVITKIIELGSPLPDDGMYDLLKGNILKRLSNIDIGSTYRNVVEFITWYNKNK